MQFNLPISSWSGRYTRESLKNVDRKDLEKEFTRLNKTMQSRLRSFEKSVYSEELTETQFYQFNKNRKYNDMRVNKKTISNLIDDLVDLQSNLSKNISTPRGMMKERRKQIININKEFSEVLGKTFNVINNTNLNKYFKFSNYLRVKGVSDYVKYFMFDNIDEFKETLNLKKGAEKLVSLFFDKLDDSVIKNKRKTRKRRKNR